MNRKTSILAALLFTLSLLPSCKKTDNPGRVILPVDTASVYVLGSQDGAAIYWKNGVAVSLPSSTSANAFFVSGSDVYTLSTTGEFGIDSSTAQYSKDGVVTSLTDSNYSAAASTIFVSGSDVYVAGEKFSFFNSTIPYTTPTAYYPEFGSHAAYWKNGEVSTLPSFNSLGGDSGFYAHTYDDYVNSIFVAGNNVYISGGSYAQNAHAEYWVNGAVTVLPNGGNSPGNAATTTSIFAVGNDVYVAGYEWDTASAEPFAVYWKNGVYHSLYADSIVGSSANAIYVSGNDVHIVGYGNINGYSTALHWKNGVITKLIDPTEASAVATSIAVYGDNLYVGGYSWNVGGQYAATYWKNQVATNLTDGKTVSAIGNAIYVH